MKSTRSRLAIAVGSLLALLALSVVAYGDEIVWEGETEATHQAFLQVDPETSIDEFGVLASAGARSPQPHEVPEGLRGSINSVLSPEDRDGIRYGTATLTSGDIAMVAGNTHAICVTDSLDGSGFSTCVPSSDAVTGQLLAASICLPGLQEDRIRVLGLAPDGIHDVAIDIGVDNSVDLSVPVTDNLYQVDLPARRSRFSDADEVVTSFSTTQPLNKWGLPDGESCVTSEPSS